MLEKIERLRVVLRESKQALLDETNRLNSIACESQTRLTNAEVMHYAIETLGYARVYELLESRNFRYIDKLMSLDLLPTDDRHLHAIAPGIVESWLQVPYDARPPWPYIDKFFEVFQKLGQEGDWNLLKVAEGHLGAIWLAGQVPIACVQGARALTDDMRKDLHGKLCEHFVAGGH